MENQENNEKNSIIKKFNITQKESEANDMFISKKLFAPKMFKLKDSQVRFITKKNFYFKIEDTNECKKKSSDNIIANEGRWSKEEHEKFLEGIVLYGINWKKVKTLIGTRTSIQVRSHAQKFFYKMKTCKDESLGIDFTLNSICNIRDMINQIKNNNSQYKIINVFKYLTYKCDNLEKSRKKVVVKGDNNFKKNELNNPPNIINLKENDLNLNESNFFFNQNNIINDQKIMKETQNINNNYSNISSNMNNQNNIINILHNLLKISYYSNAYNFLLSSNVNSSNYDITNSVNKLLINFLITNNSLNNSNLINENILLSLALQNNILNNINNINFIHNINNNIDLNNVNYKNNINDISNYNFINNIENGNKNKNNNVKDNQDFGIHIDEKDNIKDNIDNNNNNDNIDNINNRDNKDCNIELNKEDFLYINKEKNNSPNEKNCINNNNIPSQSI